MMALPVSESRPTVYRPSQRPSLRFRMFPSLFARRFGMVRSLSHLKVGTHSALLKESHTAAHRAKQGAFRMGALLLPSVRFACC